MNANELWGNIATSTGATFTALMGGFGIIIALFIVTAIIGLILRAISRASRHITRSR